MKRKQGISLIVLVITIIVMIILAASVVITLSNSGIINKANDAVKKTNLKEVEQLASITWAEEYLEGKRGETLKTAVLDRLKNYTNDYTFIVSNHGVTVTPNDELGWRIEREYDEEGLITKAVVTDGAVSYEIGTVVNYMPDGVGPTNYTGGWKLLGVDDEGRLLIMSATTITGSLIELYGSDGFINGPTLLNTMAGEYKDGVLGIDARSINVSDIDKVTGYIPDEFNGEKYIEMAIELSAKNGNAMTQEEILAELGFSSMEEIGVTNINLDVTYSWDGTEFPKYTYALDGKTYTGHLQTSHKNKGFTYYDTEAKKFVTVPFTTTPGDIATIRNDTHVYHALLEYAQTSNAFKMLFLESDGNTPSKYWLANNFTSYFLGVVAYGVRAVVNGMIYGDNQWSSYGQNTWVGDLPARAVVTLAEGTTLEKDEVEDIYYIVNE